MHAADPQVLRSLTLSTLSCQLRVAAPFSLPSSAACLIICSCICEYMCEKVGQHRRCTALPLWLWLPCCKAMHGFPEAPA